MKTIYLTSVLIIFLANTINAQNSTKRPILKYYSVKGELIPHKKVDSVFKAMINVISIDKKDYGQDSVVIRFKMLPDKVLKEREDEWEKRREYLKLLIGTQAKNFSLTDLKGKKHELFNLKGKVVVINFWFTTCPPCIEEMPALNNLKDKHEKSKVEFLALTFDEKQKVEKFLEKQQFNFSILSDAKRVIDEYGITLMPTTLVVDKRGKIVMGVNTDKNISELINEAINKSL